MVKTDDASKSPLEKTSLLEELERVQAELKNKELELQKTRDDLQTRLNDQLLFEQMMRLHYTKEKELTKKLEIANEELKRKERIKDEFISIASHELRTPIQTILGFADLGKAGVMNQDEAWNGVIEGALRLRKVAKDILDVSRIESGQLAYKMERVRINKVILDIVNGAKAVLNGNVNLETNLDEDIEIVADMGRITQALGNVIFNAVKFTKQGKINVESHNLREENKVEIKVSDTGIGIDQEILPNIFGKFVSKDPEGGNQHGAGLGLFISKAILNAHNGEISGCNNDEGGATFRIVLPIGNSNMSVDNNILRRQLNNYA